MSKTVKQIADELGVSKTAVRKKMAVLFADDTANQFAETVSGVIHITVSGENLIKQAFSSNQTVNQFPTVSANQFPVVSANQFPVVSGEVSTLISMLQQELDVKNKQIEELNNRLSETTNALQAAQRTAEAAQALHAGTIHQQLEDEIKTHWWSFRKKK